MPPTPLRPGAPSSLVLVVEDDEGVRAYLVAALEHRGFRVVAASSGEEGLERLGSERARLAVIDVGLPGMDGFAVADALEDVPVIIVTGDPVGAYAKASVRPELEYRVLPKPVPPDLFEHALAETMAQAAP